MDHVLIISDIEGSSGCWSDEASDFKTEEWAKACAGMSLDVNSVVKALFDAGVKRVTVKDFHRTAYNLLPEMIDRRARIVQGYRVGPVPGIGDPEGADILMMIGMHAASGSGGFLAHTLTSRLARLEVNGKLMSEVELFSSSLATYGIRPVFFSGCPVACLQAEDAIRGISTYPIDKSGGQEKFDLETWKRGLADAAVNSLQNSVAEPYLPEGPFEAVITLRDGSGYAEKLAGRWGLEREDNTIFINAGDINELYYSLIRICYLTKFIEKTIVPSMFLYNLYGRMGLRWARKRIRAGY